MNENITDGDQPWRDDAWNLKTTTENFEEALKDNSFVILFMADYPEKDIRIKEFAMLKYYEEIKKAGKKVGLVKCYVTRDEEMADMCDNFG